MFCTLILQNKYFWLLHLIFILKIGCSGLFQLIYHLGVILAYLPQVSRWRRPAVPGLKTSVYFVSKQMEEVNHRVISRKCLSEAGQTTLSKKNVLDFAENLPWKNNTYVWFKPSARPASNTNLSSASHWDWYEQKGGCLKPISAPLLASMSGAHWSKMTCGYHLNYLWRR